MSIYRTRRSGSEDEWHSPRPGLCPIMVYRSGAHRAPYAYRGRSSRFVPAKARYFSSLTVSPNRNPEVYADTTFEAPGWISEAERRPSSHWDHRPEGIPIDLLVIHNISLPPGQFGGPWIDDLFLGRLDPLVHPYFALATAAGRVSTHLLVRRDGHLVQYVPFALRAWHAGASCFQGREGCNDFAIGIELEGDDCTPFEPHQYRTLIRATRTIMAHYPAIDPGRIRGHSDIAPGRKTDPGPYFDWDLYLSALGR